MRRSRFPDSQILAVLRQAEAGTAVPDLCREDGIITAGLPKNSEAISLARGGQTRGHRPAEAGSAASVPSINWVTADCRRRLIVTVKMSGRE